MARKVPTLLQRWKRVKGYWPIENRSVFLVFSLILGSSLQVRAADTATTKKTLQILEYRFSTKPQNIQKTLLRQMALLNTVDAVPFFIETSLNTTYGDETRQEALKGMLAIDSTHYRPVLDVLQSVTIKDDQLIQNLDLIDGIDLLHPLLSTLTFKEEKRIVIMKLSTILRLWNDSTVIKFDFSKWPSKSASAALMDYFDSTKNRTQRTHIIELWGHVRDEKSTKKMVKLLELDDENIQSALIDALSHPGSNMVSALGRFLQKSKNPHLREKTIQGLKRINTADSKQALDSYLPQASEDEKKWIEE